LKSYSFAGTKFAIESDVDLAEPKIQRYLQVVGDHVSIQNDIASFNKEHDHYVQGKTKHMTNFVSVIQELTPKLTTDEAKIKAYELQLQTEKDILAELDNLANDETVTAAEWKYIEACLIMAAGNLFTAVAISRYGGNQARIASEKNWWNCNIL
jgi:hypothetical protein